MDRKSRLCLAVRASGPWRLLALALPAARFKARRARTTNRINETIFLTSYPLDLGARPGYFRLIPKPSARGSTNRETKRSRNSHMQSTHRGGPERLPLTNIPEGLRYTKDHEW